ncbi:hypothetical protein GCM10010174_69870 [Kutzneria viridogrisea]|uniref:Uncharacterized protein n=1 Tax=Kutzneria viridogrisea TaxID=47990 RepID=A0ABR6BAY0_9PSEU|nr:hypothetical protein [Kutzneria viridogrisea]
MATGPEHYREAEKLLRMAADTENTTLASDCEQAAKVHATLALAAATALMTTAGDNTPTVQDAEEWRRVASALPPFEFAGDA